MDLERCIGLGIAGNFTGHLEQAGEASDFVGVEVASADAPKGIFPFYVPGAGDHFLHTFPVSSSQIALPAAERNQGEQNLQIEPELALVCEIHYRGDVVAALRPTHFSAHNDCSIRKEGASKISEKKNWGRASKGTSRRFLPVDRFEPGGALDHFRLASYLRRGDALEVYGVDSAVTGYSYFYARLLSWLVDRMNHQEDAGPLESISHWLAVAGHPERALLSVGATRYTEYGEKTFLERGDEAIVAVYDARELSERELRDHLRDASADLDAIGSVLRQTVV